MNKVLIIYTGGTIGMASDPETGSLIPLDFAHLSAQIPELKQMNIELGVESFTKPIDSSNISPKNWIDIAAFIQDKSAEYDGFVLLHGTDTMSYTAAALSFLLKDLHKPVILTGSQLPIGTIRTDGKENLITAIEIAGTKDGSIPMVPEVCIYFETQLFRGNRTRKYNSENFDAFQSPNYPVLADAGIDINYHYAYIANFTPPIEKFKASFSNEVAILKIFPGMDLSMLDYLAASKTVKGIVLESFGAGNAPSNNAFIEKLANISAKNIPIVNITQCYGGPVVQGKYETSIKLKELGVISGHDLSTEAACIKLMFALGQEKDLSFIRNFFNQSIVGECTL